MRHKNISTKIATFVLSRTTKELSQITRYEIAEKFNINRNYLSEKFKRDTGITVFQFIEFEKITRAKYLLNLTDSLTIEEISKVVGIRKVNQFRWKFKKYYHITPGQYRRSLKNRQNGTTGEGINLLEGNE